MKREHDAAGVLPVWQSSEISACAMDLPRPIPFSSAQAEDSDAYEWMKIMLDATPLCCTVWSADARPIDCNRTSATFFELSGKQEYLDRFYELSPEFQPDGRTSHEAAAHAIAQAIEVGTLTLEWMHRKLDGEPVPAEITLVRVRHGDGYLVASYMRDLRETKARETRLQEADERLRLVLDATPLGCTLWDTDSHIIDCNDAAVRLFDLSSKQELMERFYDLSPEFQSNGRNSQEQADEYTRQVVSDGQVSFDWMHQKLNGERIPAHITLVRIEHGAKVFVAGYIHDLRQIIASQTEMREADDRARIMFEATPLCCNFWDESLHNVDCNQEVIGLFELNNKQEYLDHFFELSPEFQPNGRRSDEMALEYVQQAFRDGRIRFEWMHQKLNGEPIPAEITLVRVKYGEHYIVAGYTRDLRETKSMLSEMREADERTRIMLDATPLCCNLWDEQLNNIDCNQEAVNLFELKDKQEYLDRFFELSPEFQPNGRPTAEMAAEYIHQAFRDGRVRFEWMHQKLNGEPVPAEITLVRVKWRDHYIVAGYTRDLRELKASLAEMREADERTRIMLDATPMCCNFWDENHHNIDCNQEAVNLFGLKDKQEYLDRFFELSPEYQPDGSLSRDKAQIKINEAFTTGRVRFEWMHQKLNGEPIPAEITLVRVRRGDHDIVAGYTRDLRELKSTITLLNKLEKIAFTDNLTGAYNRHFFLEHAEKEYRKCLETDSPMCVIMFDLDFFKVINDTYGHSAGDVILKEVTATAQSVLRPYDLLARYGGEEFIILITQTSLGAASRLAERIRRKIASAVFQYRETPLRVTISLGVAEYATSDESFETLVNKADKALYKAKHRGRNRVELF
ncbi:sensor domain-containing diguanylate cyclase [Chitiniphilus shinanonensis]|uniref:sensor domain-containing diguanylate cyclase n=1 Tax=Chitiniphilus shinanonensis TaxID=553088 RepID=UPI00302B7BDD